MDRLHRWKTHINGENFLEWVKECGDLPVDKNARCSRCSSINISTPACFIGSKIGIEVYLCGPHSIEFSEEQAGLKPFLWFCLSFDEIEKLDMIADTTLYSYSRQEAEKIYYINAYLYHKHEVEAKEEIRVWYISIDASTSRAFYNTFTLEETGKNFPGISFDEIKEQWAKGNVLVFFLEPVWSTEFCVGADASRVNYMMYLPKPSNILASQFQTLSPGGK
jgi:hypothetical protein